MDYNLKNAQDFYLLLRQRGFRVTTQRRVVVDVLVASGGNLTAEEIYQKARRLDRHINLATIYRTLTVLRESGLVQQYYISPDHSEFRFQLIEHPLDTEPQDAQPTAPCFHFHCLNCGQIKVLDSPELLNVVLSIFQKQISGLRVKRVCLCAEGYCPECARTAR